MLGMGIIFLPGMMTGQILSGTSPVIAIEYQIAIMLE
jgi:putative ABC transport system permease protein